MYILYFKSYEQDRQVMIILKLTTDQCGICSGYLSYPLFFAKRKISFEVSTFGGSLFPGDCYFHDLLRPVTFYRYFRRFATFEGSLLSEFSGISKKLFLDQLNAWLNRKLVSERLSNFYLVLPRKNPTVTITEFFIFCFQAVARGRFQQSIKI